MNRRNLFLLQVILIALFFASCGKKTEETMPVRKDVTETVFASGVLEAEGTYSLTAQTDGYLRQVNFSEGDTVRQGETLATIENRENIANTQSAEALYAISKANTSASAPALQEARNSIYSAHKKLETDSAQMQRYQRLYALNSISKNDYDNIVVTYTNSQKEYNNALENYRKLQQQAQQDLISSSKQKSVAAIQQNYNEIKAVISGRVYKKYKQTGDYVRAGDVIAQIGNKQLIYAKVNVDETNIAKVKLGDEAAIQLNISKDKIYKGRVAEIYPSFDDASQSFICKLLFVDSLDFRVAGTQLQSNIIIKQQKNALLIPRNYLSFGSEVMVKGKKEPVKIVTGFVSNNWVQILSGIDDNTVLVTDNISSNKMTISEVGSQMR